VLVYYGMVKFFVSCKTVYWWVTKICYFMSDILAFQTQYESCYWKMLTHDFFIPVTNQTKPYTKNF